MSTATVVARLFALIIAFIAVAALAAYARGDGEAARSGVPACCIYMIF